MTNLILFITLLAIIWYTIETRRLANFTAKQIKITIKPILVVTKIDSSLYLKNIGKSPALNILVKDIVRIDNNSNRNDKYIFKFTKIPVCGSNEVPCGAGITPYCNGKAITASGEASNIRNSFLNFSSLPQEQNYELIIDYEDIEKGKWSSISIVDSKGVHFKEVKELI